MTVNNVLARLAKLGDPQTKKTHMRHGAREPLFGVKIEHLKVLKRELGTNYELSLELFATGNSDAMYLAGLIADSPRMKQTDLERWVKQASWSGICNTIVAGVTASSRFAAKLAAKWIDSPKERIASTGWATWSCFVSITPDEELDLAQLGQLIERVGASIASAPNLVRYTMNGFVIAAGCFVRPLTNKAKAAARSIGKVSVDMGDTACQVPNALESIARVEKRGTLGAKRKAAIC